MIVDKNGNRTTPKKKAEEVFSLAIQDAAVDLVEHYPGMTDTEAPQFDRWIGILKKKLLDTLGVQPTLAEIYTKGDLHEDLD